MANFVYVTAATLLCGHGGPMTPGSLTSTHKLTVKGQRAVTADNITAATIATGCSQVTTTASPNNLPCLTILSVTSPLAAKLTVNGKPVAIDKLAGTTNGKPLGADLAGTPGQSLLTAK
jgi:hypothetical protein